MLRSLYSGVSGLTSHQTKMDVIGNNIANVNTYGFKGSTVAFSDIYYQTTKAATGGSDTQGGVNPSQIGYGTQIAAITKNMSRSSFQSTSSALDVAIAGDGFLQVQDKAGNIYYTRAGKLTVDSEGNLVDSNGKFVLGTMNSDPKNADGLLGTPGSSKIKINIPNVNVAKTGVMSLSPPPAGVTTGPTFTAGFLNGDQKDINITFATGATEGVTAYDSTTSPATMTITLKNYSDYDSIEELQTKINTLIEAAMNDGTLMNEDNFTGGKITISMDTSNSVPASLTSAQIAECKKNAAQQILTSGLTMTSTAVPQSFSNLTSFTISENGTLIGIHPVHGTLTFGRIDLATFDNTNGLEEVGNTYFAATANSGKAKVAVPGFSGSGSLVGSALEMSNVNLAQEFTDMITAQRGFQANARIITTSDSMLEELVNLKR
jgi:flagellar hook protein FlgE